MGSNERDQTTQNHPPHISSLVVRPSVSNDEEAGRHGGGGGGGGEYKHREVSRDRPSFARSDRHEGDNGHRTHASSSSPSRRVYEDHRHGSGFNHSGAPPRGREFSSRREPSGRHRDHSPPYVRGGADSRPHGRGFDGPEPAHGPAHGPFKSESLSRNTSSKIQPRDGDWYCLDQLCRNLNFARRQYCNKCKKHRYTPANSPPPPRVHPPPMNLSPRRDFNGFRSPPRGYPRDYLPPRQNIPTWRDRDRERERDRLHYSELDHPPSRRIASDWVHNEPHPEAHYDRRRPLSPPLPPPRGGSRWGNFSRERSRSPPLRDRPLPPLPSMRGGQPPLRDHRRDSYLDRGGREDRRGSGSGRDRIGNSY